MEIQGTSLRGVQNAETSLSVHARNIANANTAGYGSFDVVVSDGSPRIRLSSPTPGGFSKGIEDPVRPLLESPKQTVSTTSATEKNAAGMSNNVDLAANLVGMQEDRRTAGYNLKALKIQDRMAGDLLNLVG